MIKIISPLFLLSYLSIHISYATPVDLQKFIPAQWEVISKANGDLNADGQSDVALLIQPENTQIQDRKLLILFKNNQSYTLYLNKKIPAWTYPDEENCINDAISGAGLAIKHGILDIGFNAMNSCSNWYGEGWTYRFQWRNKHLKLIGFEYWFIYKTDGKSKRYSGNFLTQKLKNTFANEFDDQIQPQISWKKLIPIRPDQLEHIQFKDNPGFLKQMIK
ncbi:hypothetical protein HX005_08385 [Acinetobacter sp. R933-2]|uniref:hypothetical protein n=1 Tax=Acinetobacter sp. R933-2 TaxID=2746728 RepID=UPI0025764497|nr:hypothetical protein [Acinetobacter sp. R933-2]MDM1247405.1 hypothetical protein [Acinetobacter sp. R933-2]